MENRESGLVIARLSYLPVGQSFRLDADYSCSLKYFCISAIHLVT